MCVCVCAIARWDFVTTIIFGWLFFLVYFLRSFFFHYYYSPIMYQHTSVYFYSCTPHRWRHTDTHFHGYACVPHIILYTAAKCWRRRNSISLVPAAYCCHCHYLTVLLAKPKPTSYRQYLFKPRWALRFRT